MNETRKLMNLTIYKCKSLVRQQYTQDFENKVIISEKSIFGHLISTAAVGGEVLKLQRT